MARSKEERKEDFNRMLAQAKDRFRKFGEELSVLARKSEKGILKASKAGRVQLDIMSLNVQKEKLYYDIGKKVANLNAKKNLGIPELEPHWKRMERLEGDAQKKRELLARVKKMQKRAE
jgi:hypothetical protein